MKTEILQKCLDAVSVHGSGGITVDVRTGHEPTEGYVFAPSKETERKTSDPFVKREIETFTAQHWDDLVKPGRYLGLWVDGPDLYLDVVKVVHRKVRAIEEARRAKQIAIYDIREGMAIRLNCPVCDEPREWQFSCPIHE